jgi:hypothetical protein
MLLNDAPQRQQAPTRHFVTSPRSRADVWRPIATWLGSIDKCMAEARQARTEGVSYMFLRLANQPYPSVDEQAALAEDGAPFLTLPDRFDEPGCPSVERNRLLKLAFDQHRAAKARYTVDPAKVDKAQKSASQGRDLTDEERQQFLDAVYSADDQQGQDIPKSPGDFALMV